MDDARASELRAWLTLHLAPGLGARGIGRLLGQWQSPGGAVEQDRAALAAAGAPPAALDFIACPDEARIERALAWAAVPGHRILTLADPEYPPLLRDIPDPPPLLYCVGDPAVLSLPQLAVVGSRNASRAGEQNAAAFAGAFASAGLTITSGMAVGIDAAAHRRALADGAPTVAVLGTGADQVYPARHVELARAIAAGGALVSEFPLGTGARPEQFPRRNRVISGLALGVLVVEAAARSGSLGTARQALEQGREVFAIPGSIHNPLARGCHALIREGAALVEHAEHVFEQIGPLLGRALQAAPRATGATAAIPASGTDAAMTAEQRLLLACFQDEPVSVDVLVERSRLTPHEVSSILLILELKGLVATQPGGAYCRLA